MSAAAGPMAGSGAGAAGAQPPLWPGLPTAPGGTAPSRVLALSAADGVGLRAAVWQPEGEAPRGLAVLLAGRAEYLEKLAIPAAALLARGFAVATVDWRGQGLSARLLPDPRRGHVGHFDEYRADLAALLAAPEVARLGPVRLVLAHSMGGPIAALAIASEVLPPVPLVLSSPMFGVRMGGPIRIAARLAVAGARRLGRLDRWPPFGRMDLPYALSASWEGNVLTGDRAVWDWMAGAMRAEPRLALGMPTLGWFDAAEAEMARMAALDRLDVPALSLLGEHERVVDPRAVEGVSARLGIALAHLPGARHEPLVEAPGPRAAAWAAIDAFLAGL